MSNIKAAFADFLRGDQTLTHTTRIAARETIRQLIDDRISDGNRPTGQHGLALTISRSSGNVLSGLSRPLKTAQVVIACTLWWQDEAGSEGNDEVAFEALKALLHKYRGNLNPSHFARIIRLESEPFDRFSPPIRGSNQWWHRKEFSFFVAYNIAWQSPAGETFDAPATVGA